MDKAFYGKDKQWMSGTWILHIKGELADTKQHNTLPILKCLGIPYHHGFETG